MTCIRNIALFLALLYALPLLARNQHIQYTYYDTQGEPLTQGGAENLHSFFQNENLAADMLAQGAISLTVEVDQDTTGSAVEPDHVYIDGSFLGLFVHIVGMDDRKGRIALGDEGGARIRIGDSAALGHPPRALLFENLELFKAGDVHSGGSYADLVLCDDKLSQFRWIQFSAVDFSNYRSSAVFFRQGGTDLHVYKCTFDPISDRSLLGSLRSLRFLPPGNEPFGTLAVTGSTFRHEFPLDGQFDMRIPASHAISCSGNGHGELLLRDNQFLGSYLTAVIVEETGSFLAERCLFYSEYHEDRFFGIDRGLYLENCSSAAVFECGFENMITTAIQALGRTSQSRSLNIAGNTIAAVGPSDGLRLVEDGISPGLSMANQHSWSDDSLPLLMEGVMQREEQSDMPPGFHYDLYRSCVARFAISASGYFDELDISRNRLSSLGGSGIQLNLFADSRQEYSSRIDNNLLANVQGIPIRIGGCDIAVRGNTLVDCRPSVELYQQKIDLFQCEFGRDDFLLFSGIALIERKLPGGDPPLASDNLLIEGNTIETASNGILLDGILLDAADAFSRSIENVRIAENRIDQKLIAYHTIDCVTDSMYVDFREWKGIWVQEASEVLVERNRIHSANLAEAPAMAAGIGLQADGSDDVRFLDNTVDGAFGSLRVLSYMNSGAADGTPYHCPQTRRILFSGNSFSNLYSLEYPSGVEVPGRAYGVSPFLVGWNGGKYNLALHDRADFSSVDITDNTFLFYDSPGAPIVNNAARFDLSYPIASASGDCSGLTCDLGDVYISNCSFLGNRSNLGAFDQQPASSLVLSRITPLSVQDIVQGEFESTCQCGIRENFDSDPLSMELLDQRLHPAFDADFQGLLGDGADLEMSIIDNGLQTEYTLYWPGSGTIERSSLDIAPYVHYGPGQR